MKNIAGARRRTRPADFVSTLRPYQWRPGDDLTPEYRRSVGRVPVYRLGAVAAPLQLSAVVVPTSRPAGTPRPGLELAARIAAQRDVPLIVLRSGAASLHPFPLDLAISATSSSVVIDLPARPPVELITRVPERASDRHPVARRFRRADQGPKRTLGVVLGRMCGWETALMMDDDIRVHRPAGGRDRGGRSEGRDDQFRGGPMYLDHVLADFAMDERLQVAGYDAVDCRDHSVFGHARHWLGHGQGTAISGGAMMVRCAGPLPFFASAYNEDWLFQLALALEEISTRPSSAVKHAGSVFQEVYDPFTVGRAQAEELGDLLGEGLLGMLAGRPMELLEQASEAGYWERLGRARREAILDLLMEVRRVPRGLTADRIYEALNGALAVYVQVDRWAELLADYVRTWRADLARWPSTLDALTPSVRGGGMDLPTALATLGLAEHAIWLGGSVKLRAIGARAPNRSRGDNSEDLVCDG